MKELDLKKQMLNKILELGYSSLEAEELIKVSKNIEEDYNILLEDYPIQYLIGYVDFYGYKINVNENVLIPRYETEYLVQKTINYSKKLFNEKVSILDIGCGSGCIGITLSKELDSKVDAIDISPEAIKVAKENNLLNNSNVNIFESDLFEKVKDKYNIIISNPPYISRDEIIMSKVDKYEPHLALYADNNGLIYYENILKEASKYLKEKYIIAFEIGMTQKEDIISLANKYFKDKKVICEQDLSLRDRYIFIFSE